MKESFVVTYTNQKTKKHKVYQDGKLELLRQGCVYKGTLFDNDGKLLQKSTFKDVTKILDERQVEFPGFLVQIDCQEQTSGGSSLGQRPTSALVRAPVATSSLGTACRRPRPFSSPIASINSGTVNRNAVGKNLRKKNGNLHTPILGGADAARYPAGRQAHEILTLLKLPATTSKNEARSRFERNTSASVSAPVVEQGTSKANASSTSYAAGASKSNWVPLRQSCHLVKAAAKATSVSDVVRSKKIAFKTPRPLTTAGTGPPTSQEKKAVLESIVRGKARQDVPYKGTFAFPEENIVPQSRQKVVANSYAQFANYKKDLTDALVEEINLQIGTLARSFYEGRKEALLVIDTKAPTCIHGPTTLRFVNKQGSSKGRPFYTCFANVDKCFFQWGDQNKPPTTTPHATPTIPTTPDPTVMASALHSRGLFCHWNVAISPKPSLNGKRKGYEEEDVPRPGLFQLRVDTVAKSGRKKEEFAINDIWIVSSNLSFTCHDRNDFVAVATSTFHGPSSTGHVEVKFHGQRPPFEIGQRVFALHGGSIQTELAMLETVKSLQPGSFPVLPLLWRAPTDPEQPQSTISKQGEATTLALRVTERFRLNEDQAAVLQRCASWYDEEQTEGEARKAVNPALCMVHGTFGAGKSTLLVALILFLVELFEVRKDTTTRILISAATNVAVDRVLLGLLKHGFNRFLRVGSKNFAPALKEYTLHQNNDEAIELQDAKKSLRKEAAEMGKKSLQMYGELKDLEADLRKARRKRLEEALVVGVTCFSSGNEVLKGMTYKVCLLDECSQMPEPLSLMPLATLGCEKLVAVGDPAQLPPQLTGSSCRDKEDDVEAGSQKGASGHGLERAMFVRLAEMGHTPILLRTQYRCHPLVSALPNKLFYEGRLLDGCSADDRAPLIPGLPALLFMDTRQDAQEARDASSSYYNDYEAKLAAKIVNGLVKKGCRPGQIGVIVPYRAQASKLNELLAATNKDADKKKRRRKAAAEDEEQLGDVVQVSTVDAFQGMEKDIIILSCCRTSGIGFLASPYRLNVALSRARHHLLILGCGPNLQTCTMWKDLLACIRRTPLAYRPSSAPLPGIDTPVALPPPQTLPPPANLGPLAAPDIMSRADQPASCTPSLEAPASAPSRQTKEPVNQAADLETEALHMIGDCGPSEALASGSEAGPSSIFDCLGLGRAPSRSEPLVGEEAAAFSAWEGTADEPQPKIRRSAAELDSLLTTWSSSSSDDSDGASPSDQEMEESSGRTSLDLCSRSMQGVLDAANFGLQEYWTGYSLYRLCTFDATPENRRAFLDSKMCQCLASAYGVKTERWRPNLGKIVREARIMMEDYLEVKHGEGCTAVRRLIPRFEDVDELKKTEFGRRLLEEAEDEEAAEASAAGVVPLQQPFNRAPPPQGSFAKALGRLKTQLGSKSGENGSIRLPSRSTRIREAPSGLPPRVVKRARIGENDKIEGPSFDLGID